MIEEVLVGQKGVMDYVLAVITQFHNGAEKVLIKARGKTISRAVDVAEVAKRRFLPDVTHENIEISTEEVEREDRETKEKRKINISAITIPLVRKK